MSTTKTSLLPLLAALFCAPLAVIATSAQDGWVTVAPPEFPGAIIFNTNCIQKPADSYKDRLFTWGLVQWPGVKHVDGWDFSAVIAKAKECPALEERPGQEILTGFGHNAILGVADKVIAEWSAPKSLPPICDPAFDWLRAQGLLTPALIEQRARAALDAGQARHPEEAEDPVRQARQEPEGRESSCVFIRNLMKLRLQKFRIPPRLF